MKDQDVYNQNLAKEIKSKILQIDNLKKEINYDQIIFELHDVNSNLKTLKIKLNYVLKNDPLNTKEILSLEDQIDKLKTLKAKDQAKFADLNQKQKELFKIFSSNENLIIKNDQRILFLNEEIYKLRKKIADFNDLKEFAKDANNLLQKQDKIILEIKKKLAAIDKNHHVKKYYLKEDLKKAKLLKKDFIKAQKIEQKDDHFLKVKQKIDTYKKFRDNLKNKNKFYQKINQDIDDSLNRHTKKATNDKYSFIVKDLNVWYDQKHALYDINIKIPKNKIIAIIGPSGCGKSTFLRTLNRINDNIPKFRVRGKIIFNDEYDIYKLRSIHNHYKKIDLTDIRTKIGMIFQQPNPFPMSIRKNVAFSLKISGIKNKILTEKLIKRALKQANLWDEVKSNLKAIGTSLSGGQQQRLCIARAIVQQPEVLLMDEPTSALDPKSSAAIEKLILELKQNYTIIIVTHSMQQAQRVADYTAFFYQGKLIEFAKTDQLFNNPQQKETKNYLSGKFG
ncbi:MAG: hypothetical protein HPPSJP_3350 [Candidatus Hepatoplasma scabrum]|nr:MAG: hypothetical protein HPPSJP_3350 [Candidatus Hepatoplasma sp.]